VGYPGLANNQEVLKRKEGKLVYLSSGFLYKNLGKLKSNPQKKA
jgi:hypothetical protein